MAPYAAQHSTHQRCQHSQVPALLGFESPRKASAIIVLNTLRLHMPGYLGHVVVPCGDYEALDRQQQGGDNRTRRFSPSVDRSVEQLILTHCRGKASA
jgi:hypothetical protein